MTEEAPVCSVVHLSKDGKASLSSYRQVLHGSQSGSNSQPCSLTYARLAGILLPASPDSRERIAGS